MKVKLLKKLRKEFDWYWDKDAVCFVFYNKAQNYIDKSIYSSDLLIWEMYRNCTKNTFLLKVLRKFREKHDQRTVAKRYFTEKRACLNK